MRAEIIGVGTELLLGQIANTNAQRISEQLAEIGVDVLFHTVVGDNEARIASTITDALARVDVVIITGGLGPTHDDLTREAIAVATGKRLSRDASLEAWIEERFRSMGRQMAPSNLRQADLPEGATALDNPRGTAPGIFVEHDGKMIFAVPGVPSEMGWMMESDVMPRLRAASGDSVLQSRMVKVTGIGESDVARRIEGVISSLEDPAGAKVALLASPGEVRIRISAKAESRSLALELIEPVESQVRDILGTAVFGIDDDTLESVIVDELKARGQTLAVAESFTGGLVISRLIEVPDVSKVLVAGYVTYSEEAKVRDLGVSEEVLARHGAVSPWTVREMAEGVRSRAGADFGLATTGEAGPKPAEEPVGTAFVGLAWEGGVLDRRFLAPGDRVSIRRWGTQAALNLLRLHLLGEVRD